MQRTLKMFREFFKIKTKVEFNEKTGAKTIRDSLLKKIYNANPEYANMLSTIHQQKCTLNQK